MVTSVSKDINYLASLSDSACGAPSSSSTSASGAQLQQISSSLSSSGLHSGGGSQSNPLASSSSRQVLNLKLNLLSMPDRNFMDGFTCHASVQPGMLQVNNLVIVKQQDPSRTNWQPITTSHPQVWMKILQQGPSSAKLRMIPLPAEYNAGGEEDIGGGRDNCGSGGIIVRE